MDRWILDEIFTFVAVIVGMGCVTGITITWMKWRVGRSKLAPEVLQRLGEISDRIARLDNAIDTVSVEIERISEAQRFTSRILAERAGAPALPEKPRPAGSTTPH